MCFFISLCSIMEETFEYQFLNQLYAGQNKLSNALDEMIEYI
jgi:hypothetical protein